MYKNIIFVSVSYRKKVNIRIYKSTIFVCITSKKVNFKMYKNIMFFPCFIEKVNIRIYKVIIFVLYHI